MGSSAGTQAMDAVDRGNEPLEDWPFVALRAISDAVIRLDARAVIQFLNPAAEALIGQPAAAVVGASLTSVLQLGRPGRVNELVQACGEGRAIALEEDRLSAARGHAPRTVSGHLVPVGDGAVLLLRDVTDGQLLRARAELGDRLTAASRALGGLAHELERPIGTVHENLEFVAGELAALRASSEVGASPSYAERALEAVEAAVTDMQAAATRMSQLVGAMRPPTTPT